MTRYDFVELRGEGNKIIEFVRSLINEFIPLGIKCKTVYEYPNEIFLKLRDNLFISGHFTIHSEKGNLYYNGKIGLDWAIFFLGMILSAVIGMIVFYNLNGRSGIALGAFLFICWYTIGLTLYYLIPSIRGQKHKFYTAIKKAEAEIRSI